MNGLSSVKGNYALPSNYYLTPPNNNTVRVQQNNEPSNATKTIATAGILQALALALQKASGWFSSKLMQGKEFTSAENVKKVADTMLKDNKLKVSVDYIDDINIKNYKPELREMLKPVARGENAFYADSLKLAVAPKNKPSLILHELGHAINAQKGKFMKFLQKSRGWAPAVPTGLLMLNGFFKRDDGKPNFIERNAGLIGFSAFLPTIVEEGLASIRGVKAAKKVLGKGANLAPLKRNYLFAWMTYLIAGLGLGVAAKQCFVESKK